MTRAKGDFKKASDIDPAVRGRSITDTTVKGMIRRLNEETRTSFFDVVRFESIKGPGLLDPICRVCKVIHKDKRKTTRLIADCG